MNALAESWRTAQAWRSLTLKARSSLQDPNQLTNTLTSMTGELLDHLKRIIHLVYPPHNPNFSKIIKASITSAQQLMRKVIYQSHALSVSIQCDVVTSRMKVTTAPRKENIFKFANFNTKYATGIDTRGDVQPKNKQQVIGTFKFGLDAVYETDVRRLVLPQVITRCYLPPVPRKRILV